MKRREEGRKGVGGWVSGLGEWVRVCCKVK